MNYLRMTACLLLAGLPLAAPANDKWLPVKDVSLIVEPGSILDFSGLLPPAKAIESRIIVNKNGQFALQDKPDEPKRFLMAGLGFDSSYPDHKMADLHVQQLRLHGYNMARLDFIDQILMGQRRGDFDFDPEQLDRFRYLLAALKKAGIYYVLDGLTSNNAAYGNIQDRWSDERHAKVRLYYDPAMQAHWKTLVERVMASANPYTGTSVLADPALAGIIMVNEGGLAFVTRNGAPDELKPLFADWLTKKYGTPQALAEAWKGELDHAELNGLSAQTKLMPSGFKNESLAAKSINLARIDDWTGSRMADSQRFFRDLENNTAAWMEQHLRQLGYKGLLTAYDNWKSPAAHASRSRFEWIDLHNYYDEPSEFVAPGSVMRQDSMLQDGAEYIAELAVGRHIGKAFTVSEYGQVFWNKYRRESALAVPAYASFQDWSMICQHTGAIAVSYAEHGGHKDAIYPFGVGLDPIARVAETLSALLFLRGDVATAKHKVGIKLTPEFAFDDNAFYGGIPSDIGHLALVTGVGLDWQEKPAPSGLYEFQVDPGNSRVKALGKTINNDDDEPTVADKVHRFIGKHGNKLVSKIGKSGPIVEERWQDRVESMQKVGLLDAKNRTGSANGVYQSDTGQIVLDRPRKRLTVITPATEAVVFDRPGAVELGNLTVQQADGPALVSVSAMDRQPLPSSKRMLLVLATDARNTGMSFADSAETKLKTLGKTPVLMRAAKVKLKFKSKHADRLQVYSNTLRGKRGDAIPVNRDGDSIGFVLDTAKLSHGPTTYFEIVAEE
ncbi:MAG: hypothetical protein ACXWF8_04395 [Methylobacter sp.]